MCTAAAVRDVRQFVFPEPPVDWEAWVEVAVELFLLVQQLPFLVIILHVLVQFHTITSLFFLIDQVFVKRVAANQANGSPLHRI